MVIAWIEHRGLHLLAACGLWWMLSGRLDFLTLSLGLVSAVFSVFLSRRMRHFDGESHPFVLGRWLIRYWIWLTGAIIKANLEVSREVFARPLRISPTWVRLRTQHKSDVGMATLANSITLTPGTISLDVEAGAISVHALTEAAAEYLQTGDIDHRVGDAGKAKSIPAGGGTQ